MKKLLCSLLTIVMILSVTAGLHLQALAEESGDFEYEILYDGAVEITGYNGEAQTLEIPSTLDGYSVISIGYEAFEGCSNLTSITIPNSVTGIDDEAFAYCDSLTSVTIPDSVTSIGDSAFWLTGYYDDDANWENGVLYIGNHLIAANYEYGDVPAKYSIHDGTVTIAEGAFSFCHSLTSITIPDSVTSIGSHAFYSCDCLTSIIVDENNKNYSSQDGVLFNKEKTELIQYPAGNERTSYTIPDSVTSIGDSAFSYCDNLTSITIPNSVTSIGDSAFSYCDNLINVDLGNGVTSIGDWAFKSCGSLTSITIPDSVTSIGASAFWETGYYNDDANWENGVLYIGNHLIQASYEVPDVYSIHEGTVTIAAGAFSENGSSTSITIPDSVTSIGDSAFAKFDGLTSITVDENNKNYSSQDGVLFNKDKTELIQYPAGNERTSYSIPDSVTSIEDGAFEWCTSLTSVTIPNSVTSIGVYAFWGCNSLTSIKIPDGVTSIGERAFWYCGLTSITIPESVTSIGYGAFAGDAFETIYGYENSYAQTYAEENGYEFVVLDNSGEQGIISEGTDDTYVIGSEKGASIHCGYPIDQFSGVLMDGAEVSSDNYTLTEGSTILTFKPAYLNSLSAGKHEVTMNFVSGSVKSILTIEDKTPETPADSEKPADTEKPSNHESTSPNTPTDSEKPAEGGMSSANGTGSGDATSPNTGSNASAIFAFATMTAAAAFLIIRKKKM